MGEQGEIRAVNFLISINYLVLDRNVRFGTHEVDIIALDQDNNELVFVEVKTRSSGGFGSPSQAVSQAKIASLRRVAQAYLRSHHLLIEHRFDIIAVLPTTIEHYKNITWNF